MATGLGKTYLAGFFAKERFNRVLFVAHREEILHQAKRSFLHIMPDKTAGLYNGSEKETEPECLRRSLRWARKCTGNGLRPKRSISLS
ncbi:DEAD/DEAH box helicase family protein [Paenibacillus tarimensis]